MVNIDMRLGLACAIVLAASPARATLIAEETFSYASGSDLRGQMGGTGWAGPWDTASSGTTGFFTMVSLAGEPTTIASSGLALGVKDNLNSVTRIFRPIDCGPTSAAAAAGLVETVTTIFGTMQAELGKPGTTLWIGFIARGHASSISAGSHLFEGLGSGTDSCTNSYTHDYTESDKLGEALFVGRGAGNANYGYERTCGHGMACSATYSKSTCGGNDYQSTIGYSTGVVHWVVMKLDFGRNGATSASGAVTIALWVDPTFTSTADLDPAGANALNQVGQGATTKTQWVESEFHFNTVELQSVTKGSEFDEYRIGTTFADLVGAVSPVDMAGVLPDLSAPPDLRAPADLRPPVDLAWGDLAGVDLASEPDLAAPAPADLSAATADDGGTTPHGKAASGCGCRVGGGTDGAAPWLAVLFAAAVVVRPRLRKRRR